MTYSDIRIRNLVLTQGLNEASQQQQCFTVPRRRPVQPCLYLQGESGMSHREEREKAGLHSWLEGTHWSRVDRRDSHGSLLKSSLQGIACHHLHMARQRG